MIVFIIRRLFSMIPMLIGVSLLIFFLMYMAPGDFLNEARARPDIPQSLIQQLEREYGLKDAEGNPNPWYVQYGHWINTLSPVKFIDGEGRFFRDVHWMREDESMSLGFSWAYRMPVSDLIAQRLPATVLLSITSVCFAWMLAIPLGVLAAIKKDSIWDRISALFAYAALSVPEFFLALLAVYLATITGWFPTGGLSSIDNDFMPLGMRLLDYAWHLVLPTLVLGLGSIAGMMRIMRANFLDYMRAEFVNTARAKGLPEKVVMFKHVLRNAINPLITSFGFAFSTLLSGSVLVENVMNYPGLGRLMFEALMRQDQYVVVAAALMGSAMLMFGNLLADVLLAWSDPRIRLEKSTEAAAPPAGGGAASRRQGWQRWVRRLLPWVLLVALVYAIDKLSWGETAQRNLLFTMKYIGPVLLAGLVFFFLLRGRTALKRVLAQLVRRPLGLATVLFLGFAYLAALFAPFLSPVGPEQQNLLRTYHPPTGLTWEDGGVVAKVYEKQPGNAAKQYVPRSDITLPLKWFAKGEEYKLFGWIPMERRLVQPDYEALAAKFEGKVNPQRYPLYLLGSDGTGRDILTRLLYGARISLTIGLIGIAITMTFGFLVGGLSGYFGGRFDFWSMRLVEFLMAIPTLYLLLALRGALAAHFDSAEMFIVIVSILAFVGWAGTARIIRGMSMSIRSRTYVLAAESMGQNTPRILGNHLLPNLASYLLVAATLSIPAYILGEANLSFLGLGIQDPDASWGLMLKDAQDMKIFMLHYWWMLLPGACIFLTVIAYNLLGDVLRDIVDPRMRTR
mgnify:CR=1 FL=1